MVAKATKETTVDDDEGGDGDFVHTRLPRALGDRVDKLQKYSDEGIVSRKAFIADAVREKLEAVEDRVMKRAGFYAWLEESGKPAGPLKPAKKG